MSLHRIAFVTLMPVLAETKEASWRFTRRKTEQKEKGGLCYDED